MRLPELLDIPVLQRLTDANWKASGMPIGIIDAGDGSVLIGVGWQEICTHYHRVNAISAARCRESDDYIKSNLSPGTPTEYRCQNGLRDIGIPILVAGRHLATLFLGQFFYEDEAPDRDFFVRQARQLGFDPTAYLRALDRVPVFPRTTVENILAYNLALARFISELAERSLRQKEAEAALRASEERLRNANRAKDEFLAMLSHELRNPLAPIRNSVYVLRHADVGSVRARRAHDVIERQAEHLTRLVEDLLDVTRITRGKIELRRAHVDLREVLLRAAEDFRHMMEERGVAFRVAIPNAQVWAHVDATRIAQLSGNLLHNAAKFTPSGGEVTLTLAARDREAVIRVRDTGAGIDPALLPQLFEPFVQGDRTLARTEGGLGLGLALVKRIAEQHGGSVIAESAGIGLGAELVVRLPLAGPAEQSTERPARPEGGRRVLVIDGNRDAAESLADIITMFGHHAVVAFDAAAAIEKARATAPDVVLCDLDLPGTSGYDVAKALRSSHGDGIRLIAVGSSAEPHDVSASIGAGFDAHVAKPLPPDSIDGLLA